MNTYFNTNKFNLKISFKQKINLINEILPFSILFFFYGMIFIDIHQYYLMKYNETIKYTR